jgi:hypothetical protein
VAPFSRPLRKPTGIIASFSLFTLTLNPERYISEERITITPTLILSTDSSAILSSQIPAGSAIAPDISRGSILFMSRLFLALQNTLRLRTMLVRQSMGTASETGINIARRGSEKREYPNPVSPCRKAPANSMARERAVFNSYLLIQLRQQG